MRYGRKITILIVLIGAFLLLSNQANRLHAEPPAKYYFTGSNYMNWSGGSFFTSLIFIDSPIWMFLSWESLLAMDLTLAFADSTNVSNIDSINTILIDSSKINSPPPTVIIPKKDSIRTIYWDTTKTNNNDSLSTTAKDTANLQSKDRTSITDLDSAKIDSNNTSSFTYTRDSSDYDFSPLFRQPVYNNFTPKHPKALSGRYMPKEYQNIPDLDKSGTSVTTQDFLDTVSVSLPITLELDEYLVIRKKMLQNKIWDSLMARYDLKQALSGGDLARMISQSTGLTIPVPPNPVIGIFGKPEININVNGEVNLRVGWRWDSQNLGTVSAFGQTQSTPVFSQDIRVNVSARIGDKLKFNTDWNTKRQFEYDNKFKVAYEGEDDDIIKLVEVGNVTLPIPSSLIGGGQALFGIRSDFQFGPLYLKTLFSQRRGERKYVNVQGGVSKIPFSIRAYDYSRNHFFVDTVYKKFYKSYFKYSTPVVPPEASQYRIGEIEVWESTNDLRDINCSEVVAFANLYPIKAFINEKYPDSLKYAFIKAGEVERGRFMRLDSMRYKVDVSLGTLNILNLRPDRYYAVGYRIEGESPDRRDDQYYGNFSQDAKPKDTLILKLIYRPNMQPGFVTLWERQMKNIYSINATNVNIDGTKIGIWYFNQNNDSSDVLQGAPDKLVTIMGVDQVNNSTGSAPPDGQFDLRPPFFDMQTGEIIFPSLKPFEDGLYDYFNSKGTPQLADQYMFPDIYDTTYDVARQNTARDRFVVSGEVSGRSTNRIALGAFNLAPGSVKVTLDGVPLREFEDYVVDYYSGQLTLRNPRASLPNANLRIEYEANDIFNISTRTLAGIRGDFQLYKTRKINTQIGFTIMHYDQSAIIDRVRLGEEPVSNTMLGLDAKLDWDIPWMTKMLDMLPFYDTKVQSSLQMRGEAAMTLPEPNKRRSEVASDNNEPVVYIDDFEGAQRYISLGLTASQWSHSSQPVDSLIAPNDSARALFRGKTFWYQRFIPYVEIKDIYPNKDIVQGRTKISPINIVFEPDIRGIYNKNEKFLDTLNPEYNSSSAFSKDPQNRQKIWGGIMRLFSSFNTNFDTENIDYIEIMMNISDKEVGTKMYVDLGQISEDIIPNQRLDTEDGITKDNPIPNNMIDKGEDVGIDALSDAREKDTYLYPLNLEKDPARDNYSFNFDKDDNDRSDKDFVDYNNYENNSLISEIGQFPDTEILNRNNGQTISLDNSYFTYEVELIKDPQRPEENPQIVGGNKDKQWFLYRIPIRKPVSKTGNPLFSNIQYIRVWFKGGRMNAHIADWRLVGSQWQRINNFQSNVSKDDSVLQVAFVNREENNGPPDYYSMPPGVKAPRQLSNPNPNEDIRLNEQSMAISAKNLRYGDERMAVRIFRPLDVFYYKRLKFFVHGDGSMPDNIVASAVPKAVAFLRFGIDSMNYYEYRIPIKRGWQSIDIELARLTAIKQLREQLGDTINPYVRRLFPVYPGSVDTFAIRGNPVLTKVQFFGFGITNPPERYPNELTTTMWVDELRLLSPEDRSDWAGIGSVNLKLADLGTINATISHTKPNFHKLEERFGDRINTTNWTVSMQGNLERFAPQSFREMKIPITYTHSEFVQDPEYVANSDINLSKAASASRLNAYDSTYNSAIITLPEEQARKIAQTIGDSAYGATIERSQTLKVLDSWALTGVRLGIPVRHWLVTETFNRITVGYSYSQEYERSPVVSQRFSWLWQLTTQYSLPLKELVTAKPFSWAVDVPVFGTYKDMKINFLPSNISASLNMNRSRTTEQSRFLPYPSPVFRNFSAQQQAQFSWKLSENGLLSPIIDYNVTSVSTLVPYELDENNRQRTGSELASKILFNNGLIDLGKTNNQIQNVTINFRPRLPIDFLTRYSDMTGSFNTTYTWLNPLQPDPKIHDIAKSASWNNVIRFNFGFRLKALGDSWFGSTDPKLIRKDPPDSTKKTGVLNSIGRIFKTIFFDYDKLDISLNQNSSSVNPGVLGGTGFSNFWGRGMLGRESMNLQGPSFAYQLGLINQPHGGFKMVSSDKFPFFGFDTYPGLRPPNAILPENYSQKTSLELRTSRPLWEGATLDLTWGTDLAYNKNQIVETDEFGRPRFTNIIATESFNRTYLSMPSFLGLNIFNNTVEHVIDLYNTEEKKILKGKNRDEATVEENKKMLAALSTAFHDGLQSFSLFSGSAGKFLPAVNWGIRWEGLQKWDFWKDYVKTASIEHAYTSKYTESAQITNTGRATQNQMVQMGFQPLVGLTVGFDEAKLKGNLTATLRYATSTGYNLNSANRATISRQSTDEFQLQASYTMRGFTFELIGLKLQNDLEFSFLASYKKNKRATYDILNLEEKGNTDGRTLDGNTKITIEPRARYSMSNRVTASFFVRYEGTFTEGAAQPGFNTTQVGLDIRIAIAGGR